MRKKSGVVISVLSVLYVLLFYVTAMAEWVDVDGTGLESVRVNDHASEGILFRHGVSFDQAGRPAVAWSRTVTGLVNELAFLRWNGSQWVDADGSGTESMVVGPYIQSLDDPVMEFAPDGTAWIGYVYAYFGGVFILKWNGTAWTDADGTGQESARMLPLSSGDPSLRIDQANRPVVAFVNTGDICMTRWNGTQWVDADGTSTESMTIYADAYSSMEPVLRLDASGNPCIAWITRFAGSTGAVYFLRWNGAEWVDADGTGQEGVMVPTTNGAFPPHMSFYLDGGGNPCIAWSADEAPPCSAYFTRWNGTEWVDADGSGTEKLKAAEYPSGIFATMAPDSAGRPHILVSMGYVLNYVRWDGSAWLEEPGIYTSTASMDANIGLSPDDTPYAVWNGGTITDGLYLMRRLPDPTSTPTITPVPTVTPTHTATPMPLALEIKGSFPNPFGQDGTNIVYRLTAPADVSITLYTVSGEVVLERPGLPGLTGYNAFAWDGRNGDGAEIAAGIYPYIIKAASGSGEKATCYGKLAYVR